MAKVGDAPSLDHRVSAILSSYKGEARELINECRRLSQSTDTDVEHLSDRHLAFLKRALVASYRIGSAFRPSWYFAALALRHIEGNRELAEKCIRIAEEIKPIEDEEFVARHFRARHAASQKRSAEDTDILAHGDRLRSAGVSSGEANRRTALHYSLSVRQVQKIRKRQKRT